MCFRLITFAENTMTPLKQGSAIIIAVLGFWLFATVGVFIAIRAGDWYIISSQDTSTTIAQWGTFYLAFFGAQLPAIAFVAFVIIHSTFRHPVLVAGVVTFIYQMVRFAIHVARSPWSSTAQTVWWVPMGLDFACIIVLTFLVMVMVRILRRANPLAGRT